MADDLSAQGSGLRAHQTKRSPHAPGIPKPAVNLRVDIDFVAKGLQEAGSLCRQGGGLSVGKEGWGHTGPLQERARFGGPSFSWRDSQGRAKPGLGT